MNTFSFESLENRQLLTLPQGCQDALSEHSLYGHFITGSLVLGMMEGVFMMASVLTLHAKGQPFAQAAYNTAIAALIIDTGLAVVDAGVGYFISNSEEFCEEQGLAIGSQFLASSVIGAAISAFPSMALGGMTQLLISGFQHPAPATNVV